MNRDIMEGDWQRLKGKVREQWGKLTNDDLDVIAGKREQLVGLLQQRYGKTREEVEQEVHEFEKTQHAEV
ncbi:MAG TPA: CsbD family protein [Gemmatimonadales bacterium]|nr:CsbD family protein [Gemmatimonadales bacterium]